MGDGDEEIFSECFKNLYGGYEFRTDHFPILLFWFMLYSPMNFIDTMCNNIYVLLQGAEFELGTMLVQEQLFTSSLLPTPWHRSFFSKKFNENLQWHLANPVAKPHRQYAGLFFHPCKVQCSV
jgi:hypothetical protein